MNDVLTCIHTRRSIRKYKEAQIPDDLRNAILEAATYAPSGSNNQSWLFTVLQDREMLIMLNDQVKAALTRLVIEPGDYPAKVAAQRNGANPHYSFYYKAPTLVIASNVPNYANAMADCSAALQNIFLSAHALGLGSCWINQLTWTNGDAQLREYMEQTLGIPKEHTVCGAATLGYIEGEIPAPPARKPNTVHILR